MNTGLGHDLLARLSAFVTARMGLHFPPERWVDLERGMRTAAPEFGFKNAAACAEWVLGATLTAEHIQILARDLTVGETYFFREKPTWEALEEQVLPALIRARRGGEQRLRFWSAGCCTGEEPYSLAILLRRTLPDWKEWNITILATDLNPAYLHKANLGVFGDWSFRDAPDWLKAGWFRENASGRWEILPDLKRMVTFSPLNLAEDTYPSLQNDTNAMDVILCRNVLMYFAPEAATGAIGKFHRALVEGGWLVVSPSEASHVFFPQYAVVHASGAILFRKGENSPTPGLPSPKDRGLEVFRRLEKPPNESVSRLEQAALYAEALSLYEQGRYAEAGERLRELGGGPAPEPRVAMLLARTLANTGQLREALAWGDRAVATDKLNPAAHYLRATILHEQGATGEAVHSLRRAIYLDQRFVLAHFDLGNLALKQGKPKEARRELENALRLLRDCRSEDLVPESEGLTAGRLAEIIESQMESEVVT